MTEHDPHAENPGESSQDPDATNRPEQKKSEKEPELTIVLPADMESTGPAAAEEPDVEPGFEVTEACDSVGLRDTAKPTEGDTPTATLGSAETPAASDAEEVFVILPEQLDGDIPIAETEEVDELDPDDQQETETDLEYSDDGEPLGAGAATDVPTEWDDFGDTGGTEPTDILDDAGLDELAAELDDDALGGSSETEGDWEDDEREEDDYFDGAEEHFVEEHRGKFWKYALPVAATVLVVATGIYFFQPVLKTFFTDSDPSANAQVVAVPDGSDPVVPVVDPAGGVTGGQDTPVREEFREKIVLALRLGYLGEVANE